MYDGERDFIRLGIPGGDGGPSTPLAVDASRQEFGGTSINVLSVNSPKPIVFDPAASPGKKGGWASKPRRSEV